VNPAHRCQSYSYFSGFGWLGLRLGFRLRLGEDQTGQPPAVFELLDRARVSEELAAGREHGQQRKVLLATRGRHEFAVALRGHVDVDDLISRVLGPEEVCRWARVPSTRVVDLLLRDASAMYIQKPNPLTIVAV